MQDAKIIWLLVDHLRSGPKAFQKSSLLILITGEFVSFVPFVSSHVIIIFFPGDKGIVFVVFRAVELRWRVLSSFKRLPRFPLMKRKTPTIMVALNCNRVDEPKIYIAQDVMEKPKVLNIWKVSLTEP